MKIEYRQAVIEDAALLVNIYNASFYDDYVRFGTCPGYGQTKEMMEESISKYLKHIILCDNEPVGGVSCIDLGEGVYEVGCLCVIPEYQGKGIGTQAMRFIKSFYEDWVRITLVTPIDKKENVKFYTEKCGFRIESTERDGNVELFRFVAERSLFSDKEYLKYDDVVDFDKPEVKVLADKLFAEAEGETDFVRRAYEYVRDTFPHSADINADEVAVSASDVLKIGHGICHAKAHLLAAILRCKGVPAGFCYQKLILDDETSPVYISHGLNGVYLCEFDKWIRLDARGNRSDVDAQFSVDEEKLAFPVRAEKGEEDDLTVYADPKDFVIKSMRESKTRTELWINLPAATSIDSTRRGFEESFSAGTFYNRQTQDAEHLDKILSFVRFEKGMKILDLGTGSGYLAFRIAKDNPGCIVTGLDIVSATLEENTKRAQEEGLNNLSFVSYDGISFPFEDGMFDVVVTRYSLHHFPEIETSIGEVSRVLKCGGRFFISDPRPNECDKDRFVDDYMRLKKDGYEEVLKKHDKAVINSYDLVETDTELYLTEQVNNILFQKIGYLSNF